MDIQFENKYDYEYPEEVDLSPGSKVHDKLLKGLVDRIKRGYGTTSNMREMWRKLDHLQTAYVPEDSWTIWERKKDEKSPVDVVIPLSRACLDISVAYMGGVFLGDPTGIYNLSSSDVMSGSERLVQAAKMECLLNTQANWFKHKLSHFIGWRDAFLYGISVKAPTWAKHKRREMVNEEVSELLYEFIKQALPKVKIGDVVRFLDERVYHEGCDLVNIDPYSLILDPYATLNRYSDAEFLGYWSRTNAMSLLRREPDPEERLFNCKYVRDLCNMRSSRSQYAQWDEENGRYDRIGSDKTASDIPSNQGDRVTNEVDIATLCWYMIPEEWGLKGDRPELREFSVAGDRVIIKSNRLDYDHGMYPLVMAGPHTSGYEMLPISGLASTYGMQEFIDWKIRVHWWNASKVQNDMFVVDGSVINVDDFMNPAPGKVIRLERPMFGEDRIDQFIKQLQVQDITANYMQDVRGVHDLVNIILGTQNIVSGNMEGMPERPTAAGFTSAEQNAFSRLDMWAQMLQEQEWYPLISQMASNNIQFMQNDMVVSIIGSRFEERIRAELGVPADINSINVSPWDLEMGAFELLPVSRMQKNASMTVVSQMMDRMLANPQIALEAFGNKDVGRMFDYLIRRMGFGSIYDFRKAGGQMPMVNPQVMPDEQVLAQQQAGNLVATGDVMSGY